MEVRILCKEASIARSWFVEAKGAGREVTEFYIRWKDRRERFIAAWERSKKKWHIDCVKHAIECGDVAVWRLLRDNWKATTRPILDDKNKILTSPGSIHEELLRFHSKSKGENSSIPPGWYEPVKWEKPFKSEDEVLVITGDIVLTCLLKLKNSSVPDNMTPQLIKLLFGGKDRVNAVGEMMRAVARTRTFPEGGKIAQQIFRWKGSGSRNKLENCRTITMANVLLKLAESCIKTSSKSLWESAGFPRPFWGHFSGAPESIYIWLSTVEEYYRLKLRPITALTDVSRAFDRLHHGLFKRKLYDFGLPRQLVELILELISGIQVSLTWGNVKTDFVERGSTGVPQGSLEGMWNFGVYSDNIQKAIIRAGRGIVVGNENVRAVTYADDISPVNDSVASTNLALKAISDAGTFNSYRFKPSKCRIVGADVDGETVFTLGSRSIETKNSGLLLGAVINGTGIFAMEHIRRRAGMVDTHIKLIKSWRTRGLPFRIAYKNLFAAKVVPRFSVRCCI